jgi:hypothetical protein
MNLLNDFYHYNQEIARFLPLWTQGAGSNISCKLDDKVLAIKASGFRLDQVNEKSGHVFLNYPQLRTQLLNILKKDKSLQETAYSEAVATAKVPDQISLRPSMEAGFHAFSQKKWVAHFHSLASVLMAEVRDKKSDQFDQWLKKNNWNHLVHFIPLSKPGWELSAFFQSNDYPVNIIVNHGVILQSDDVSLLSTWDKIEDQFLVEFKFDYLKAIKDQFRNSKDGLGNSNLITRMKTSFDIMTGPVKFYFPDMAIYFSKLEPHLKPVENHQFQLQASASEDLKEIWLATQILYRSLPGLSEIPEKMTAEITQLPTEKLRQKFLK